MVLCYLFIIIFINELLDRGFAKQSVDFLFMSDLQTTEIADSLICILLCFQIRVGHEAIMHRIWVLLLPSTILSVHWPLRVILIFCKKALLTWIIEGLFMHFMISTTFKYIWASDTFGYLFWCGVWVLSQLSVSLSVFNQFDTSLQYSLCLLILVWICALSHFKSLYLLFNEGFLDSLEAG